MKAMLQLYSYWRSSSAYRVRIALNLKLVEYECVPVHLVRGGGEQHSEAYRALNPQARVPLLVDGDFRLAQSLAIFHYLEARVPHPALVPDDIETAARMWAFCQTVACDIQPLQNSGVLQYLDGTLHVAPEQKAAWLRHWIARGLDALEAGFAEQTSAGRYCFGDTPTYADCCLVPQWYAALRFGVDTQKLPQLSRIVEACATHPAFVAAAPERQPDAAPG